MLSLPDCWDRGASLYGCLKKRKALALRPRRLMRFLLEKRKEPNILLSSLRPNSLEYLKSRVSGFCLYVRVKTIGMIRCFFPLLLIPCQLTVFALTLPTLLNLTAESTPLKATEDPEAHCTPADESTQHYLPIVSDCIRAVRALPETDYVGTFHMGGDYSLWRLPVTQVFGSCKALVSLHVDVDQDLGSWDDVRRSGARLLIECQKQYGRGGVLRTGGWITSGAENGIVIELAMSRIITVNGTGTEFGQDTTAVEVQ